jgi:uncharacterized repeat protein (TIGR03803 family)
MQTKRRLILFVTALAVAFGFLALGTPLFAAIQEQVLYGFNISGMDGNFPLGSLIFDGAGNLYGTATGGGTYQAGAVFQLAPGASGVWTEKVLYSFCPVSGCPDGLSPRAGLIFDGAGNLYGITDGGGAFNAGAVFELTPGTNGTWTEQVVHSFNNDGQDGIAPNGTLIFDAAGKNLFGTTIAGGTGINCSVHYTGCGTVFELTPGAGGTWTEQVLHSFTGTDGAGPWANLIFDAAGNLYGTTSGLGNFRGTVFELMPSANGTWTEKVLFEFGLQSGTTGAEPFGGLIFDAAGNLYGTTLIGGSGKCDPPRGCGVVFELTPGANGTWTEKVLYNFKHNGTDGTSPESNLIFGAAGKLYGTTVEGGAYGFGTVFRLTLCDGGKWMERVLHSFNNDGKDGVEPAVGLIFGTARHLYGTTEGGGTRGGGTVFEVTW